MSIGIYKRELVKGRLKGNFIYRVILPLSLHFRKSCHEKRAIWDFTATAFQRRYREIPLLSDYTPDWYFPGGCGIGCGVQRTVFLGLQRYGSKVCLHVPRWPGGNISDWILRKRRTRSLLALRPAFLNRATPSYHNKIKIWKHRWKRLFHIFYAMSSLFQPVFCVLPQRPCVYYTELHLGFVGRSLTKMAQNGDIFFLAMSLTYWHWWFYVGYLSAEDNKTYLPNIVTSTLKSIVAESDYRQNRMIFKLAVELAAMMNVVVANINIDPVSLERLRGECVKEVKRLNGAFSFDDAVSWQKGWEENEWNR